MRGVTADPNTGPTGRDPDCNMASSTRGANEERVHTAGAGLPAAKTPLVREEAGPRDQGVLPGVVAEESYTPNTATGGIREEGWVKGGYEVRGGGSEDRGRWLEAGQCMQC